MGNWQGKLHMTFHHGANETGVECSYGTAPLKFQKPFYPEGKSWMHGVILHTAGGIVGGDQLDINLRLRSDSKVLLTTATAGKVYRSIDGFSCYQTTINLQPKSILEWFPQETILFEGAQYRSSLHIELDRDALCFGWDIYRFGRSARGEHFHQGTWRSRCEVWQNGSPLWIDRQFLPGSEAACGSPNALAGKTVLGSFWFIGLPIEGEVWEKLHRLSKISPGEGGMTRLEKGFLCRYRGMSTIEARQWFIELWDILRQAYCHRSVCLPRVW